MNYADVRMRVGNAFAEKANEISNAVDAVQALSKEATRLPLATGSGPLRFSQLALANARRIFMSSLAHVG